MMPSVDRQVPQHQATAHSTLEHYWKQAMGKGTRLHQQHSPASAIKCFMNAVSVAEQLLSHQCHCHARKPQRSSLEMLFFASHNLSACHNECQEQHKGEQALRHVFRIVVATAVNERLTETLRIEALGILDRVLFSLTSQLGYLNKTADIYEAIRIAEETASRVSRQLFH